MRFGAKTVIYTDTATDGMLGGPNLTEMASICDAAPTCRIAQGGMSSPFDVENLKSLERPNLCAAIVGKTLYDGRTTLKSPMWGQAPGRAGCGGWRRSGPGRPWGRPWGDK